MSQFNVRPFAFMRLTHEALRAGFQRLKQAASDGDVEGLTSAYDSLRQVIAVHAAQEEEVFFPMLDRLFDDAVRKAGLRAAHQREHDLQASFEAALRSGEPRAVMGALEAWSQSFEDHLKDEEDVMMPLTQKVAPDLQGRAAAVRQIAKLDWESTKSVQVPYVVQALSETKPYGPLRMYVAALQLVAADDFHELQPLIQSVLPEEKVSQLRSHGHLT